MHPKKIQTSGKIKPNSPDQSPSFETIDKPFLSFLIIGVSNEKVGNHRPIRPEIIYEYPKENCNLSEDIKIAIVNCSFPTGIDGRQMTHSGSDSELNEIVYGQIPQKRGSKCFTFTLRSSHLEEERSDMPNSNKELLYVFCVEFEDLSIDPNHKTEWVIPKLYCFVTYLPIFELHYEVISKLLLQKRLFRIEQLIDEKSLDLIENQVISPYELKLLEAYSEVDTFSTNLNVEITPERLDKIVYKFSADLTMIDIPYLCAPLFSSLSFDDFFWLLWALAQEKSIVLVSANLGLLSSCVLALQVLLRPFKWPNLMIPIIPDTLIDMLDAPIPILVGTSINVPHKGNLI